MAQYPSVWVGRVGLGTVGVGRSAGGDSTRLVSLIDLTDHLVSLVVFKEDWGVGETPIVVSRGWPAWPAGV